MGNFKEIKTLPTIATLFGGVEAWVAIVEDRWSCDNMFVVVVLYGMMARLRTESFNSTRASC